MSFPKVYCIPGFGVDERIFSRLKMNAHLQVINWIEPLPNEAIQSYALRMSAKIDEKNPIIIGVSFGGMMAIEINKLIPVRQIILISSVKCRQEQPFMFRVLGTLRLNRIIPLKRILKSDKVFQVVNRQLGATTIEEVSFATAFRYNASVNYIRWSFEKILNWQNRGYPPNIIHIHGDKDRMLPIANVHPTHVIKGGTHMMVFNRAEEISKIIDDVLLKIK